MDRKLLYILGVAACMSCSKAVEISPFVNGDGKTAVALSLGVDGGLPDASVQSKAADDKFEDGDLLLTYLRHVQGTAEPYTLVDEEGTRPKLAGLKVTPNEFRSIADNYTDHSASSPLTVCNAAGTDEMGLYWDDFSTGGIGDPTHIRTDKHYLQSYYGYCYNGSPLHGEAGSNISAPLVESTGVLGWSIPADQTGTDAVKHADLLWSGAQEPVAYSHEKTDGTHGLIRIPFTHAMSMISIDVIAKDGYSEGALANTSLELQQMYSSCSVTAPAKTISENGGNINVTMYRGASSTKKFGGKDCTVRSYQAIVIPGKKLDENQVFVKITNAEGNNYTVSISGNILTGWNAGLVEGRLQSGYNYKLTVTIDKLEIDVQSTLDDWIQVEAEGKGDILMPDDDVTDIWDSEGDPTGEPVGFSTVENAKRANFGAGSSFTLYRKGTGASDTYVYATTSSRQEDAWVNAPALYWPNSSDKFFFRALAVYNGKSADGAYRIESYDKDRDCLVNEGTDYIWATTPAHKVRRTGSDEEFTYARNAAVSPRTGNVPLAFEHIMSKITVKLNTPAGDSGVDLDNATITISNLTESGKADIDNGSVVFGTDNDGYPTSLVPVSVEGTSTSDGTTTIRETVVIPQKISPDSRVRIQLADKSTYSLALRECMVTGEDSPISQWYRGMHYVYTITLTKGEVSFRAMVKDWKETAGSGNADIEWD